MKRLPQKESSCASGEDNRFLSGLARQAGTPSVAKRLPARIWVELTVGLIGSALLTLAIFLPNWMELSFHVAPDAGDGSAERGFALVWAAISVVMFGLAGRTWRKHVRLLRSA